MLILAFLFWTLMLAPLTAFLAGQRGYPVMTWYLLGLLMGPFGLLACRLPRRGHEPELRVA